MPIAIQPASDNNYVPIYLGNPSTRNGFCGMAGKPHQNAAPYPTAK